jgi:hypothetical protein
MGYVMNYAVKDELSLTSLKFARVGSSPAGVDYLTIFWHPASNFGVRVKLWRTEP